MLSAVFKIRRFLIGAVGISAILAAAPLVGSGTATADLPELPNCTAADMAGIASGVAAATSAYLFTHPDVNEFFTGLRGRPKDENHAAVSEYFDAHPQEHAELKGIRQPLTDFHARCDPPSEVVP